MKLSRVSASVLAGVVVAVPLVAMNAPAQAAAAPCTKSALKKAIKTSANSDMIKVTSFVCKKNFAGAQYTIANEADAAAMLIAKNGKWKVVSPGREARLCAGEANVQAPRKVKNVACVS